MPAGTKILSEFVGESVLVPAFQTAYCCPATWWQEASAALHRTQVTYRQPVCRNIDLPQCVEHIHYYAGWADKIHGKVIPVNGEMMAYTYKEPIGVVGQIIPW